MFHRGKQHKCICALPFLVGKHHDPQSIHAKFFLPMIPISIDAYVLRFCGTTFVETAVYSKTIRCRGEDFKFYSK